MILTIKKAIRDLQHSPGRTIVVIVALAVGLWGIGGMLVSYVILMNDLNQNFINTHPAHAVLIAKNFARLDLMAFRQQPEIESAEFRDLALERIEVRPNEWIPLCLFGVENISKPELALIFPSKGNRVPPPGTMLIERDGQLISNLHVASHAAIRASQRIVYVPVSGIAFDPAQAPATQDHFIYAYADKQTYANITNEPLNQRLIVRFNAVHTTDDVRRAVDRLVHHFSAIGIQMLSINVPNLNEHPHQWQLNTLLLLQGSIGFLAFVMGATLVSQLMTSILAKQIREIGVLKSMGATCWHVFTIYLTMIAALGMTAGVIAIPLAVSTGFAFSCFVAGKLNFDILTAHLPVYVYVALAAASLLLPMLLSLPAIMKALKVSVHDALSDYGISLTARSSVGGHPSGLTVSASWLPRAWLLAIRNSMRQRKRLAVTVVMMALGVAIFSTGFNVRASLALLLADVNISMQHDVQVVLKEPTARATALAVFANVAGIEQIETWNGGRGELQSRIVATSNGVGVVALPFDTNLFKPRLIAGRWLQQSALPEIVLNQQAEALYGQPRIGSNLSIAVSGKALDATLVGVIEELEKPNIYIDAAHYDAKINPQHNINSLMFVAKDRHYDTVMKLKRGIEAAIAPSSLNVLYVMSQAERVKVIYDHLNIVLTVLVLLSLLVLIVAGLGMASATSITILERTREIGVMRAIGATPQMIFKLFVTEGMLTSVISIMLGLLMAWPLSRVAAVFFGKLMLGEGTVLRYVFSVESCLITLIPTLAFGWLASRIPARRAIQLSTRDALSYE